MRIVHESSLYLDNSFLTVTYSDENLPAHHSLDIDHHKLFMKRLRKYVPAKIRFYMCGEYGDETHRPHYHYCMFNWDPADKKYLKTTETGNKLYTSEALDRIWGLGDCYIGDLTFESAAYCGRYCMKKLTGRRKSEYGSRVPEFSAQSRKPGVGAPWLAKWKTDVFPHDYCVINGKKVRVPKYYDSLIKQAEKPPLMDQFETAFGFWKTDDTGFPVWISKVKLSESEIRSGNRIRSAKKHSDDQTPERLLVRQEVHTAKITRLTRM